MKQAKTTPDSKEGLHTQGEWKFDGLECILSESGEIIADIRSCNHDGEELENQVFNRSQEEAEANAELIVKAVNERKALLDALGYALERIKDFDPKGDESIRTILNNAKNI